MIRRRIWKKCSVVTDCSHVHLTKLMDFIVIFHHVQKSLWSHFVDFLIASLKCINHQNISPPSHESSQLTEIPLLSFYSRKVLKTFKTAASWREEKPPKYFSSFHQSRVYFSFRFYEFHLDLKILKVIFSYTMKNQNTAWFATKDEGKILQQFSDAMLFS